MTLDELQLRPDQVRSLYLIQLQQVHSAEHQLLTALPNLAFHISATQVKKRLMESSAQTSNHVERLQNIFAELGEHPTGPSCGAIKALVTLSEEIGQGHSIGTMRDLLLIGIAREMKAINMAKYTMAGTFAETLGYSHHSPPLTSSKQDDVRTDRDLTHFMRNVRLGKDLN